MTSPRDDDNVETTEQLLAGEPVADAAAPAELVALLATLREAGREAAPAPSAELARVLREGRPPNVVPLARRRAARPMTRRAVVTVALGTKIALVSAAAAAALTGVATLEPVPDVIRDPARDLVDGVVGVLPWVPDAPAEAPVDESPTQQGTPGEQGEDRRPADGPGQATPGEEPGRSDEAPGRPTTPPGEPGRDDDGENDGDDAPGRSEDAPGDPGRGSSQGGQGDPAAPGEQVPSQAPADPPAGPPADEDGGSATGTPGGAGRTDDAGRADAASAVVDPYPGALAER